MQRIGSPSLVVSTGPLQPGDRDNRDRHPGCASAFESPLTCSGCLFLLTAEIIADCDIGMRIQSGGNAIFSNEFTSNTKQVDIVANNRVGPLATGTRSPAINTNTGGNGMGSTDPNANILY